MQLQVNVGMLTDSDGVFNRDPTNPTDWVQQSIVIQAADLVAGQNSIRVESGDSFSSSSFPLDDFMLKDMILVVVPEPSTITLLLCGLASLIYWRRRK